MTCRPVVSVTVSVSVEPEATDEGTLSLSGEPDTRLMAAELDSATVDTLAKPSARWQRMAVLQLPDYAFRANPLEG